MRTPLLLPRVLTASLVATALSVPLSTAFPNAATGSPAQVAPDPSGTTSAPDGTVPTTTTTTATATTVPGAEPSTPPPTEAPEPAPATTPAPAPPIDVASLQRLLAERQVAAEASAQAGADAAAAAVTAARDRLAGVQGRAPAAEAALAAAEQARSEALDAVETARRALAAAVVESFQVASTTADSVSRGGGELLGGRAGFDRYSLTSAYSQTALASLQAQLRGARQRLDQRDVELRAATEARSSLAAELAAAESVVAVAEQLATLAATTGATGIAAARAVAGGAVDAGAGGPTVLGPSVVGAADMAAFVTARGTPDPSIDMEALAGLFVSEGAAEGVRGDIAFVQSILETGWFSFDNSMVTTSDHNYAGIGACDSCRTGFGYPTPQMGVRAQMQLLRTYATPGLTTAQLAHPPVRLTPEQSSVDGCCDTWMALSGVWATGPGYGVKILTLYNEMLAFAATRLPAG